MLLVSRVPYMQAHTIHAGWHCASLSVQSYIIPYSCANMPHPCHIRALLCISSGISSHSCFCFLVFSDCFCLTNCYSAGITSKHERCCTMHTPSPVMSPVAWDTTILVIHILLQVTSRNQTNIENVRRPSLPSDSTSGQLNSLLKASSSQS